MGVKNFAKKFFSLISGPDSVKKSQKLGHFGKTVLQKFLQKCIPNRFFNHCTFLYALMTACEAKSKKIHLKPNFCQF